MANLLFFAPDLHETAQVRRIRAFAAAGHGVASVSMRKPGRPALAPADWPDVPLGEVGEERLAARVLQQARGLRQLWRERARVRGADVIVARNLDMGVLALLARTLAGRRVPVVYECLDVHGLLTRHGAVGRIARWAERRLLRRAALLVVSSPAFVQRHFAAVQGFHGPWQLVENKLWFPEGPLPRPEATARPPLAGRPLVLGWVGAIRCAPSLDLLLAAAERMGPDRLQVRIAGVVHDHAVPGFAERVAALPNVTFAGPYRYPEGLADVYGACDLVWAQDLWQRGANSDWLLPNRIYEASWWGCPSVAVAGTETAAKVDAEGLGLVIPEATPDALAVALSAIDDAALLRMRRTLLDRDPSAFALGAHELDAVVARALEAA